MTSSGDSRRHHEVLLQTAGRTFAAPSDRTLLAAAQDQGIELPSSCRNGTCRTCLQPLRSGTVEYAIAWPGLLPEERHGGWVLPCVAYPRSDVVLG